MCLLLIIYTVPLVPVAADTASVTHSISVSSTGNGVTKSSVKTIINGVTVEDVTIHEPGIFTSVITDAHGTTSVETLSKEVRSRDAELLILLEKLKMLLQYYVSLYTTK